MIDSRFRTAAVAAIALALVASAVTAAGVAVTSQHQESQSQDTSYLRVVHASPDAPAVNVTLENETVLSNVTFGQSSDYLSVPAGSYNVTITTTDGSAVVFDGTVDVAPREVLSVYASGEVSTGAETSFSPAVYSDDAWTPGENESALSLVHLSPDAGQVDVVAVSGPAVPDNATDGVVLAENLTFRNTTDYLTVPAGDYTVEIRASDVDNGTATLATVDVSLAGGEAYSAVAAGYVLPQSAPANTSFTVIPLVDATQSVHLPGDDMDDGTATPTPAGTATATPAGTATATPAGTATATPAGTATATPAGTATPTATDTGA